MKLPKTLTHAILVGITAGSFAACSYDVITHDDLTVCGPTCTEEGCPNNPERSIPWSCGPCGMG